MGMVIFYHLTRSTAHSALQAILPRALDQGWRVLLRGPSDVLHKLDGDLWTGPAFIPHGLAGGEADADHPILLGNLPSRGFDAAAQIGATAIDLDEAAQLKRLWILFHSSDDAEMASAREMWLKVKSSPLTAQYFSEDSGRWVKKASVNETS